MLDLREDILSHARNSKIPGHSAEQKSVRI